jgi:hypothetical protein
VWALSNHSNSISFLFRYYKLDTCNTRDLVNNQMMPGDFPTAATHSLKLEETAKGLRISVHVYSNDQVTVIEEAFNTLSYGYTISKG